MTSLRLSVEYLMYSFIPYCTTFLTEEAGQDLIEYALVAALVGLGAVVSMKTLGTKISSAFTSISSGVTSSI